jgi:hypothetical protein
MGNGIGAAGAHKAGWSGPDTPEPPSPGSAPWALKYDAATRDFLRNDDGTWAEVHPVTHEVMLRLCVVLGAIPAAPELGNTLRQIAIATDAAMSEDALRRTERALKGLVGVDVELGEVVAFAANRWRAEYRVTFKNLRERDPVTRAPAEHSFTLVPHGE